MSALSLKFGGYLKQLFSKNGKADAAPAASPTAAPPAAPVSAYARYQAKATAASPRPGNKPTMPGVEIPLQSILAVLPLELKSKVVSENTAGLNYSVPVTAVLSQLASGTIKVPYGEIRQAAPDIFTADDTADGQNVALPLHEVLSRLNPALLTRRPTQKQVVIPEEVASPFSGRGEGLNFAVGNNSPQAPGAPVAPQVAAPAPVAPVQRASSHLTAPLPGGTDMFQRRIAAQNSNGKAPIFPRKPGAPASNGTEFTQRKPAPAPAAPALENVPDAPIAFKPVTPIASEPVAAMAPVQDAPAMPTSGLQMSPSQPVTPIPETPAVPPLPAAPPRPKDLFAAPPVARSVQPAKPAAQASTAAESNALSVPLAALAESWPEAVRQEIVQFKLAEAQLAMPADMVEASLKRGRVAFNWKTIRSWVRPGPAPATSPHDGQELELPLVVIAPLFVARRKSDVMTQPRVTVAETIPNLFFGLPKPESAPAPKVADTNFYTWGETSDHARVDDTEFKRRSVVPGGTELMVKCATPNEIVSRAAALDGVAGALIALPDGLMVANAIPPEFNGDTLAAFLPHIFSKVSQCTKELRMGDLNNLNFTVGNVPWKIFRVNAIFFAAFGRVGEGLPTAELASLAGELDRKRS